MVPRPYSRCLLAPHTICLQLSRPSLRTQRRAWDVLSPLHFSSGKKRHHSSLQIKYGRLGALSKDKIVVCEFLLLVFAFDPLLLMVNVGSIGLFEARERKSETGPEDAFCPNLEPKKNGAHGQDCSHYFL